ncbi:uncharacterized protein L969DRAFT_615408 [Mixia osmundae IAM 14324]|uniref:FACT complex subunit n=1 Tax=Mixia osmundae (strain CBS 9802 / IAM 14324 / JCM 22182 / KY 12970) TaxID=764103 RepID=G7DYH1_MIXOS|nr:uncharacterized protein L969DRAFT_615408 [Mixia osmundae IAM 14324]KEI41532.1 hypothetical protein L969DRAFT_615408 [Mixia osmundae IAM 14324]GAA95631.1 hypothetical protein E5Q_02287 [Mixia osmundae IAM 14324]
MADDGPEIDVPTFYRRLRRLRQAWKDPSVDIDLTSTDAVLLVAGGSDEANPYRKTTSMQTWLLGYEFPSTLILFEPDKITILGSSTKIKILNPIKTLPDETDADDRVEIELLARSKDESHNASLWQKITDAIAKKRVGQVPKDVHTGKFVDEWERSLKSADTSHTVVDVANTLASIYSVKEEDELTNERIAAKMSSHLMVKFADEMTSIIDQEQKVSHEKLASRIEAMLEDQKAWKKFDIGPDAQIDYTLADWCFTPIIQSGGSYDLKASAQSDEERLRAGVILCSLGVRYKSYCSNVSRTFMIDPAKAQEEAYVTLLDLQKTVMAELKPGATTKDVYLAAQALVKERLPDIAPHFVKNIGFATGLEFREGSYVLGPKGNKVLKEGMTFNLALGFADIPDPKDLKRTYALLLSDTVHIGKDGASAISDGMKSKAEICLYFSAEDTPKMKSKQPTNGKAETPSKRGVVKTRTRNEGREVDDTSLRLREQHQAELAAKRQQEGLERFRGDRGPELLQEKKWKRFDSYPREHLLPDAIASQNIHVDYRRHTVILPINGYAVPFHVNTLKSTIKQEEGEWTHLRFLFVTPGQITGKKEDTPFEDVGANFIRGVTYRSMDGTRFAELHKEVTELKKAAVKRENEKKEMADLVDLEDLIPEKRPQKLPDVWLRPPFEGKRSTGTVELHQNGIRWSSDARSDQKLDIPFNNIKHLFFQPCDHELIVLVHCHLKSPILVGKKKTRDVQFYREASDAAFEETGNRKRRRMAGDEDEIENEQEERRIRARLNREFKQYADKIAEASNGRIDVDGAFRELSFSGVPFKSNVLLQPTTDCLVHLTDSPFLVVTLADVEVAHLERVQFGLKNFDLVFVLRDFSKPPIHINTIPMQQLEAVKSWLDSVDIAYSEGPVNLSWPQVMRSVTEDPYEFFKEGGWSFLGGGEASETESGTDSEDGSAFEASDLESSDDPDSGSAFSEDSSAGEETPSGSDIGSEDESDEGSVESRPKGNARAAASMAERTNRKASALLVVHSEIVAVTSAMRRNRRWSSLSSAAISAYGAGGYSNALDPSSTDTPASLSASQSYNGQAPPSDMLAASLGLRRSGKASITGEESINLPRYHQVKRQQEGATAIALISGFSDLRRHLRDLRDEHEIQSIDALSLLHPFLEVIRSGDTSGPITAIALGSVDRFIGLGLIHLDSPSIALAMANVSSAGTHCKFEASDSVSDEIVLMRILDVLKNTLTSPLGQVLTDEAVCEMMETGLSMCCQMRLSEMLRRTAEKTMQALVASVFSKLQSLPTEADNAFIDDSAKPQRPASVSMPSDYQPAPTQDGTASPSQASNAAPTLQPYGLASIRELLRVLVSLLNPHDQQHTDSMRLMALGILNTAFEVGGKDVGRFLSMRSMVSDALCKHLFVLARSENTSILSASLRVISVVFDTMAEYLKPQWELFLSFTLDKLVEPTGKLAVRKLELELELDAATWGSATAVSPSPSLGRERAASPAPTLRPKDSGSSSQMTESKELLLEYIGFLTRTPDFLQSLWVNYDCNIDCEDLYERLVRFICRGVFPTHAGVTNTQDGSQMLCLDTVLTFVHLMATRLEHEAVASEQVPANDVLGDAKERKRILLAGASRFNEKPKLGLAFLEKEGIIYNDPQQTRPQSLALFFKSCPRLDKKLLGDFISRPDNVEVLKCFMELFDFKDRIISDAMRDLLETFRLPGEAQQIARITETFAEVYFAAQPPNVKSQDAAYILAYSVIMLNTDLYNPQNRKRMTIDEYRRNLRGVNDNSDFDPEYLKSIYESIRKREIVMPEEHLGQLGFEYAWKELMSRAQSSSNFVRCSTSLYDGALFRLAWKPILSALAHAFTTYRDEYFTERTIAAFRQCALLASRYEVPEVFDFLITTLAKVSQLGSAIDPGDPAALPKAEVEGYTITISPQSVNFGGDFKAQLASVVLFNIANSQLHALQGAWVEIFEIFETLFTNSLMPTALTSRGDFLADVGVIPMRVLPRVLPAEDRRADSGLLSTLSSYLMSPYNAVPDGFNRDVNADDIEKTLCTIDCIASCRLDELYGLLLALPLPSLQHAARGLLTLLERETLERLRASATPDLNSSTSTTEPSQPRPLPYSPASVFLLELLVSLVAEAPAVSAELWPPISDFFAQMLAVTDRLSPQFTERLLASMLRLSSAMASRINSPVQLYTVLAALKSVPVKTLVASDERLALGLQRVLSENHDALQNAEDWESVFYLWRLTVLREEAAKVSFSLAQDFANGRIGVGITADNVIGFISVLTAFANASNKIEQQREDSQAAERSVQAVELVRSMQSHVDKFLQQSKLPAVEALEIYWLPVLSAFAQQSCNAVREVRQVALGYLQRSLVANDTLTNPAIDLAVVFERLIFPMLDDLLKPQVFRRDPIGMGETRLRACALLCKIFLHYLMQLSERKGVEGVTELWVRIIGYLDRFMHSGRRDQMYEAVPESLKNVLLVMHASGLLVTPQENPTEAQVALWNSTFSRIDTFLPTLKTDLFPAARSERPTAASRYLATAPQGQATSPRLSIDVAGSPEASRGEPEAPELPNGALPNGNESVVDSASLL